MKKEDKGENLIKGSKMKKSYYIIFSLNFGFQFSLFALKPKGVLNYEV